MGGKELGGQKTWGGKRPGGQMTGGQRTWGAKDRGANIPGGKRPGGKRPGGKRPGGKSPVTIVDTWIKPVHSSVLYQWATTQNTIGVVMNRRVGMALKGFWVPSLSLNKRIVTLGD